MERTPLQPVLDPPPPAAEPDTASASLSDAGVPQHLPVGDPGGQSGPGAPGTANPGLPMLPGLAKLVARENTERLAFVATIIIVLVALGVAPLVAVSVAAGGLTAAETHRRRGSK